MSKEYSLQVIRAEYTQWQPRLFRKAPKFYVQLQVGDTIQSMKALKKEGLVFVLTDVSAPLSIILRYKSLLPCQNIVIGRAYVSIDDIHTKRDGGEMGLDILQDGNPVGKIYVSLKHSSATLRAEEALEGVKMVAKESTIVRSATAADSSAVDLIDKVAPLASEDGLYESLGTLVTKLDVIAKVIDDVSKIHPYLNAARQVASSLYKVVSNQFRTDKQALSLLEMMNESFAFLQETQTLQTTCRILESNIIRLLEKTTECCEFLKKYLEHGFARRMLTLGAKEEVDEYLHAFGELKDDVGRGLALHNALVSAQTSKEVNSLYLEQRLNVKVILKPDRPICLKDTGVEIRRQIIDLLNSDSGPNIIWLRGVAGSGKSTIAATIEDYFRDMHRLGAYLLFERGKSEPDTVIRSIALNLALFDSSIGETITEQVKEDQTIAAALLSRQFEKLILQPLTRSSTSAASQENASEPIIIILDALDECGTSQSRASLMTALKAGVPKLPPRFRFFITGRPEADLVKHFSSTTGNVHEIELDYRSDSSRQDVHSYLRHELPAAVGVADPNVGVPDGWPWDTNLALLSEAANGLFIWASTAVKLVSTSDAPLRKLKDLVSDSRSLERFGLNELYATVLRSSGISWDEDGSRSWFCRILSLLLFSKVPLSDKTIDRLLGLAQDEPSYLILSKLRCLLAYTPGEPVRVFHASFSDYLQSPDRRHDPWFIDAAFMKAHIATRCFSVMKELLRFNICNLETSFNFNRKVHGLDSIVRERIPPHLEYACIYWSQHLSEALISPDLITELGSFASDRLLFWFEVLSLLGLFGRIANRALQEAISSVTAGVRRAQNEMKSTFPSTQAEADVLPFLRDAMELAAKFLVPITESTPHIYISMIPLMSEESVVARHYFGKMAAPVLVERIGTRTPPRWLKVLEGHTSHVQQVGFSPNGKYIVSRSPYEILLWDVDSGTIIRGPFETSLCAVFLPDGKKLALVSEKSMRVMDIETDDVVQERELLPAREERDSARDVFSTVSADETIQVWNSERAEIQSVPLVQRMEHLVSTPILSKYCGRFCWVEEGDGICVYDPETGKTIYELLKGNSSGISCLSLSASGTRLVAGFYDGTVVLCDDLEAGGVISQWLKGHTNAVICVTFSSDGKRIASGSHDMSVRVWSAEVEGDSSKCLPKQNICFKHVAFSPDGAYLAAWSEDGELRIWDVRDGEADHQSLVRLSGIQPFETASESHETRKTYVSSMAFAHESSGFVFCSRLGSIAILDLDSKKITKTDTHIDKTIVSASLSPDGTRIATIDNSGQVTVRSTKYREVTSRFQGPTYYEPHFPSLVPFSLANDTLLAISFDRKPESGGGSFVNNVGIWDGQKGEMIKGPWESADCLTFSLNGARLASYLHDIIFVRDSRTGVIVARFDHEQLYDHVRGIALSPDGTHVAACSIDCSIRISDVRGTHSCDGTNDIADWTLDKFPGKGWIRGPHKHLLCWVPPEVRPTLWQPRNTDILNCEFSTRLDFTNAAIGERWQECFKPIKEF